jgi:hypothetical protein
MGGLLHDIIKSLALTEKTHSGDKAFSPWCPSVNCMCFLHSECFHPSKQSHYSLAWYALLPAFSLPCLGRHSEAERPSSLESGSHSLYGCEGGEGPGHPGTLTETISSRSHFWSPRKSVSLGSVHSTWSTAAVGKQLCSPDSYLINFLLSTVSSY